MSSDEPRTNPVLRLPSIHYSKNSLAEGTAIPPPAQEPLPPPQQPPPQPVPEEPQSPPRTPTADDSSTKDNAGNFPGPLSSHPVTPIEGPTNNNNNNEIPDSYNFSRPDPPGSGMPPPNITQQSPNGYNHAVNTSEDSNNFDPTFNYNQPLKDTSRRPSFVSRIMRFRSSSFLRTRSRSSLNKFGGGESSTNLSRQPTNGDYGSSMASTEEFGRGTKRPASPGYMPTGTNGTDTKQPQNNTFPRMVRKKSMELLSSARRRSGMWGNSDRKSVMELEMHNERERERQREAYEEESERKQRQEMEAKEAEKKRIEQELLRSQPPPQLPSMNMLGSGVNGADLGADDLFRNIG